MGAPLHEKLDTEKKSELQFIFANNNLCKFSFIFKDAQQIRNNFCQIFASAIFIFRFLCKLCQKNFSSFNVKYIKFMHWWAFQESWTFLILSILGKVWKYFISIDLNMKKCQELLNSGWVDWLGWGSWKYLFSFSEHLKTRLTFQFDAHSMADR